MRIKYANYITLLHVLRDAHEDLVQAEWENVVRLSTNNIVSQSINLNAVF